MNIELKRLHPKFGAEVQGLDVRRADEAIHRLHDAVHTYGMLVFRKQYLSDDELSAFAGLFGPLQELAVFKQVGHDEGSQYVARVSNIDENGALLPRGHRVRGMIDANQLWHTDNTYLKVRAAFSFLAARIVPPAGGETEFCDTRVGYESLGPELRAVVDALFAEHSALHSRRLTGFTDWDPDVKALFPAPVRRPLVHDHPVTRRRALCLASHIERICDIPEAQSATLLEQLMRQVTEPQFVYRHAWCAGDLLMWDNRCTMHRACPYEEFVHARDMRSARVLDSAEMV